MNWCYLCFAGVSAAFGVAVFRCFQGVNLCSEARRERNRGCSCWSRHRLWWAFQQHRGGNVPELDCAIRKKRKLLPPYIDSAVFPSPKAEAGKFRRRKLLRELWIRYSGSQRGASILILQRSQLWHIQVSHLQSLTCISLVHCRCCVLVISNQVCLISLGHHSIIGMYILSIKAIPPYLMCLELLFWLYLSMLTLYLNLPSVGSASWVFFFGCFCCVNIHCLFSREDITFTAPMTTLAGIDNYKTLFWALRFHSRIFFKALWVDVVRVWQPSDKVIMIRWTVRGIPRVPWEAQGRFDGTSEYKLDKDGKIYEHKVDNVIMNSPPRFKARTVMDLVREAAGQTTPTPSFYQKTGVFFTLLAPYLLQFTWVRFYWALRSTLVLTTSGDSCSEMVPTPQS